MKLIRISILAVAIGLAYPVWAWGPNTDVAVVLGASQVISRDGSVPLNNLVDDVRNGASVTQQELTDIIPMSADDPMGAIEREMSLLQAVRGPSIDPYFAYRLGVLGKLVANFSTPLADGPANIRTRYFADVERSIEQVNLIPETIQPIDPKSFLPNLRQAANANADIIEKDYQTGVGFAGIGRASLPEDASRSVNAIAQIWFTVLTGQAATPNLPKSRIHDYVLDGLKFYINRGRSQEIDRAYKRLSDLGPQDADMRKRIGDMFFDAKMYDRAIKEYKAVLEADPNRRDASQRLAKYYVAQGEDALKTDPLTSEALNKAKDSFTQALKYDKLHPTAQQKLLQTEKLIRQRKDREDASAKAIARADALRQKADTLALNNNTAKAITDLFEAQNLYGTVTDEFPKLASQARVGASNAAARINQLKSDLINNAANLSGTGSNVNAQIAADKAVQSLDKQALEQLVKSTYDNEIDSVRTKLRDQMLSNR